MQAVEFRFVINIIKRFIRIPRKDAKNTSGTGFIRAYKQFWPFLKPYAGLGILGMLLTIPVGALDAVVATFLKPFTDQVMIEQNEDLATLVPLIIVGFAVIQGLFIYAAAYVNGYVGGRICLDIKEKLYQKLLNCETAFFDSNTTGNILFRFSNDPELASNGLISNIKLFLTKFFSSLSLVCVLIYQSWQLSLVAVGVLICLIWPMKTVKHRIKVLTNQSLASMGTLLTLYNETTGGNRVIKSFGLKNRSANFFTSTLEFLFNLRMSIIRDTNWLGPAMHLVTAIGVAGTLYYGLYLIMAGTLTPGGFVAFLAALLMLYSPIKNIGNNYVQVQFAMLALDRICQILNRPSFEQQSDTGRKKLAGIRESIEFSNVHFRYTKDREVLKGISFKIPVGKKYALVGNSGGGKSTICSLIPRFYQITSGKILIDGQNINDLSLESLRSQIAVVFQDNFLFEGTIRDNLLCGKPNATKEELINAVKEAYLDEFIADLKNGLDTRIGERGITLSGGQQQRVAIARAVLKNAPLVILDEATSALDNQSEKIVQKALDALMKGRTTIVIAHRLSTVMDADCIMVLNEGKIVETGRHEDLIKKNGAYTALYNSQFAVTHKAAPAPKKDSA